MPDSAIAYVPEALEGVMTHAVYARMALAMMCILTLGMQHM